MDDATNSFSVRRVPEGRHVDCLIIGAGPAGLQLGYFLERGGDDYLILEAGDAPGSFFKRYPRHRKLISINKVHTGYSDPEINLRWDWNSLLGDLDQPTFASYSEEYFPQADTMVEYLQGYAREHKLRIEYRTRVERVARRAAHFEVHDSRGRAYTASRLIVATGLSQPNLPGIPGIHQTENYVDVSVDPQAFVNQRVLVLGKGNSAFEVAENLIPTAAAIHVASPRSVRFAWQTHYVGHLRAVNNNFLDTYQLKSQNAVLDCEVRNIGKDGDEFVVSVAYAHAGGEEEKLRYDRVICCTGFRFDPSIFDEHSRPELSIQERFPTLTSAWESTNVPDLYFAGTLMQMRDFKKYTSGFIHGFRYNVRALYHILKSRYDNVDWPSRRIERNARSLTRAVIRRINRSSGLWQQFSVLADVLELADDGTTRYCEEVPLDYLHESKRGSDGSYFTVNLEFGNSQEDPFRVERHPEPARAAESFFLHPVVRHCRGGEVLAEHHLLEDLAGEWKKQDVHVEPLRRFFEDRLETMREPERMGVAALAGGA